MPRPPHRRSTLLRGATACLVGLVLATAACGSGGSDDAGLTVVATTPVLADFVRVIAGERLDEAPIELVTLLRAGVDPHDHEATAAEVRAVATADVILANGAGFERFLDDLIRSAEPRVPVTDTSRGVVLRTEGDGHHHDEDEPDGAGGDRPAADPHIWHDPANATVMVRHVTDALVAADPEGAATYRANREAYVAHLEALDAEIEAAIGSLEQRTIVTEHGALGYYADRYGLDVVGTVIPGFDSSAEPSAADVDELVRTIRSSGATVVFAERSLPGRAARAIAEEAGIEVVTGEDALYSDTLGPPGSGADTYLSMMRHNTATIVAHLR